MGGLCSCCKPPLPEVDERSVLTSRSQAIVAETEYRSIASNIAEFNKPPPVPEAQAPSTSPGLDLPQRPETARARSVTFREQKSASDSEDLSVRQRSASDTEADKSVGLKDRERSVSSELC
ncbi:hypothetical protein HPB50_017081 [Hyalomma asiaticum]|uniref:Uncharacterized protein n=1 Tax=Hyalomma asiaticum TaxID=266040 RepID=A0ACB7TLS7_HYAAI|nr:hypothetical protein HPB50_017081 [Hyalomma asiaticum]